MGSRRRLAEHVEMGREEDRGVADWGEAGGEGGACWGETFDGVGAEVDGWAGCGEPVPDVWEGGAVETVRLRFVEGVFRSEDDGWGGGEATASVEATEALAQGVERGDFCDEGIEVEIGSDLNALGGDENERGDIRVWVAASDLVCGGEVVDCGVTVEGAHATGEDGDLWCRRGAVGLVRG
jgi:hypothetical protein